MAEVSVDAETGQLTVHRIVIAQDVGCAINPLTVSGQMMGGAAQGAGWALCERLVYDDEGQLLTGTLMDYAVPSAQDIPPIETLLVERSAKYSPHGARGVGEPPIIATAGAIANAVRHGTGRRVTSVPLTPSRVLAATPTEKIVSD
jgi:CO/xanthine dehydrogenase Mo-binding subunit